MTLNTNTVPQGLFGPGILWLTRTDIVSATPVNVGYINEFSTDFTFETKQLYGQNQFALLAARGTAKTSGKMKAATLSGQALNAVLFGGTWDSTKQYDYSSITSAIPATPYEITLAIPRSGTLDKDLGVTFAATGQPLTFIGSGTPTTGQYTIDFSGHGYTFAAADTTLLVTINYVYTYTMAVKGQNQVIVNNPIGTTPTFQLDYVTSLYGATYYLRLFSCIGGKWSQAHKLTDFSMPEYDFEFFANAAQQIGIISLATQA
jgi:hypothetical protein